MLRTLISVLYLDRDPEALRRDGHRVHTFRPYLGDDVSFRFFEDHGVEAIGSANEKWSVSHRTKYGAGHFIASLGGRTEAREREGHRVQRETEGRDAASVDRNQYFMRGYTSPLRCGAQRSALDGVLRTLITKRAIARAYSLRKHRGVLPRTVVVKPRWMEARLPQHFRAALRQRLMWAAGQITFLEINRGEHLRGNGYVLRLASMRGARERELIVAPGERVQSSRRDKCGRLNWFRARAPGRHERWISRRGDELAACVDDSGVHTVTGLENWPACRHDIQIVARCPASRCRRSRWGRHYSARGRHKGRALFTMPQ